MRRRMQEKVRQIAREELAARCRLAQADVSNDHGRPPGVDGDARVGETAGRGAAICADMDAIRVKNTDSGLRLAALLLEGDQRADLIGLEGDALGFCGGVDHQGSSLVRASEVGTPDASGRTLEDTAGRGPSRPRPAGLPMPVNGDGIARVRKGMRS